MPIQNFTPLVIPAAEPDVSGLVTGRLGDSGGVTVTAPDADHLQIDLTALRALDLCDSPRLQTLDLRGAAPGIHLCVRGCEGLRLVRLPADGGASGGAVLHIDGGNQAPDLRIEGAVAHIDACWAGSSFLVQPHAAQVWAGGLVTGVHSAGNAQDGPAAGLLVLLCGGQAVDTLQLPSASGTEAVVLVDAGGVRRLLGPTTALTMLEIAGAAQLAEVELAGPVQRLLFARCAALARVRAQAGCGSVYLHDGSGAAAGLALELKCDELVIADSRIRRLSLAQPTSLQLLRCFALNEVTLPDGCPVECEGHVPPPLMGVSRVFANEALLGELARRHEAGDAEAWPQLCELLPHACQPRHVPAALKALLSVLASGADAAEVWQARNMLNLCNQAANRNQAGGRKRAVKPEQANPARAMTAWRWQMSNDLAIDGWRADFTLWRDCSHLPGMQDYARAMARDLVQAGSLPKALLPPLLRPAALALPPVRWFLRAVIDSASPSTWDDLLSTWAEKILHALRDGDDLDGLREAALQGFIKRGPSDALLRVMASQMQRDPLATRLQLSRLISNTSRFNESAKSVAEFRRLARILMLSGRLPEGSATSATSARKSPAIPTF